MKRLLLILVCAVMLVCGTAIRSFAAGTDGVENMPMEVLSILSDKWLGWSVTGWVNPGGFRSSSACAFATIHKDHSNLLVAFGYKNNKWVYKWYNPDALPQRDYSMILMDGTSGKQAQFSILEDQPSAAETFWIQSKSGKPFLLTDYVVYDTDPSIMLESITVRDENVRYWGWKTQGRTVSYRGSTQRDLQYFSWSAFPKTPDALKTKLTAAPDIPAGDLVAQDVHFAGGKKYDVYSAPSSSSLRGANGKARVSTNGWIQVFGTEGDWVLIQYSIDAEHYRFGYISKKALPKDASVTPLNFAANPVRTSDAVSVTDDPLFSHTVLATLPAGSEVTYLGSMGNWAYIEATAGGTLRGFVPMSSVSMKETEYNVFTAADGTQYPLFVITKMHYGSDHKVTAVTGHYERVVSGEEHDESETAPGSEVTYTLAADFRADMTSSMTDFEMRTERVTDLYQWYLKAYLAQSGYDGHELVYSSDLKPEEQDLAEVDFWFVTTRIDLNDRNEIEYMSYYYVPWA